MYVPRRSDFHRNIKAGPTCYTPRFMVVIRIVYACSKIAVLGLPWPLVVCVCVGVPKRVAKEYHSYQVLIISCSDLRGVISSKSESSVQISEFYTEIE